MPDIRQEAEAVSLQLLGELDDLAEGALNDPGCFRDMPTDWSPRQLLVENTSEHYQHHLVDIPAWPANLA